MIGELHRTSRHPPAPGDARRELCSFNCGGEPIKWGARFRTVNHVVPLERPAERSVAMGEQSLAERLAVCTWSL
ncbi:MAG: hypothetical protein WBF17_23075, partial [Phycisphaerae bacterium]